MSVLDRAAVYGVPALAGLVTAAVLLGPAAERPSVGARVHALPGSGATELALRVQVARYYRGAYEELGLDTVDIAVARDAGALGAGRLLGGWRGGGSAWLEALVPLAEPVGAGVVVRVSAAGVLLAEGSMASGAELPVLVAGEPIKSGPVEARVERGVLVAPFVDRVELRVSLPEAQPGDAAPPSFDVSAAGADMGERDGAAPTCQSGRCVHTTRLPVRPTAPSSRLVVETRAAGRADRWDIELPVHNGGMWLDPDALARGVLALDAAIEKDVAFVSLLAPHGRVGGVVVPMKTDDKGFSHGEVPLPALPDGPITALVSADAVESITTSVAWPLRPAAGLVEPRASALVLDGLPAKKKQEKERRARTRWPALALLGAAALFELAYLWRRGSLARERLQRHLRAMANPNDAEAAVDAPAMVERTPLWWLSLLALALVLVFGALAGIVAFAS
jgi:hypothetical protein